MHNSFKLEKERLRQEMERMKQAAEKEEALWQAKETLETAMDGGVAASWAVAPVYVADATTRRMYA